MKRRMMTPDELQEALKGIVAKELADREVQSVARSVDTLRGDLASSLARTNGWLSPAEKISVLHRTWNWEALRSRERVDLLMAAGCYREAIPIFETFSHWRKIGDAQLAMGEIDAARSSYERGENKASAKEYAAFRAGPDLDRLIALAIRRQDWRQALDLVRQGKPDPLGKSDVVFGGSNRAKGPLVKLCAHASWRLGDAMILTDMPRLFAMSEAELKVIFANAASGAFERDVTKLANPGLLKVKPSTLASVLRDGATALSGEVAAFFDGLDVGYREALANIRSWQKSGAASDLDRAIYWLTHLGSYDLFQTLLFRLRCDLDAWVDPHPTNIDFYVSHAWLTRACMRELLGDLIRGQGEPTPAVLLSCAIQHSASPFELDFEKLDAKARNMEQIRSQPTWAEAVVARWASEGRLTAHWTKVCAASDPSSRSDPRRLPAYGALCNELIGVLEAAWERDFNEVRWKAEEAAFLTLKLLLPDAVVERHARPSWLSPQHLDIFLPEYGIAIEYQGEQHYRPIDVFGGEAGFAATVERDERKRRICKLAGIKLECIRYDESVDDRLRQIAGSCRSKVGAR
jgi:hypothetical protein